MPMQSMRIDSADMRQKTIVNYGFDESFAIRNSQKPHYSITGDQWVNFLWQQGGAMHEVIAERLGGHPLKRTIRWHLTDNTGTPMHYIANSIFWWEVATGRRPPSRGDDGPRYFAETIVLGALPDDPEDVVALLESFKSEDEVTTWLKERQPKLLPAMRRDMEEAGVVIPD